jgi:small subunit ribosomal protein S8
MTKDIRSEIFRRIQNALRVKSPCVEVPKTRMTSALAKALHREGLVAEVSESFSSSNRSRKKHFLSIRLVYNGPDRVPIIKNLRRVSRPGLRIYTSHKKIPTALGGLGVVLVSTSQGLLSDRDARRRKLGGEILCSLWLFLDFLY